MAAVQQILLAGRQSLFAYWRIYVTAIGGGSAVSIAEVELRSTVGGADMTSPSTPTTQSSFGSAPYTGSATVDDTGLYWYSTSALPQWVRYYMGSPVAVAQLTIASRSGGASEAPSAFILQASNDGATWLDVKSFSGLSWADGEVKTFNI